MSNCYWECELVDVAKEVTRQEYNAWLRLSPSLNTYLSAKECRDLNALPPCLQGEAPVSVRSLYDGD